MKIVLFIPSFSAVRRLVFGISVLISLAFAAFAAVKGDKQDAPYVPGELLVKFARGAAPAMARQANDLVGARVVEQFEDLGWQRVKLPDGMDIDKAIERYKNMDGVEYV